MQPRFVQIKSAILRQIETSQMKAGDKVASENQLAEQYSVSRMTARRALTELVEEGILLRSQGLGTFVSDHRPMSSMLEIRSIQDEIEQRGHIYSNVVLTKQAVKANSQQSAWFGIQTQDNLYHTQIVHLESSVPIQLEDRLVNPLWAPDYLQQDFSRTTANQYLSQVAPLTQADHSVEAILAAPEITEILNIPPSQPCLHIVRRTFSTNGIVSFASLYHPGNRYRIGGHLNFHPSDLGERK
ncbi:histidine utilization repressor [Aliiglaciecola sp. LCG003]|uniref:histidine utilization repressor n=1 Tax=Aliiglaciecola sp. LCG003 TaxID=3053655 RepID=UPI0025742312|nr:histidine utilization repressor [Aliiglaciecola sp. LCG003]WJG10721.1 histidine utilization repressor [Aliiglaciecola sp. LCG003]